MADYEEERIVRSDVDPVVRTRRTHVVDAYEDRSSTYVPLLALSAVAIVGIILLLMYVSNNATNDRVTVTTATSAVMGEHVSTDRVSVATAPAPTPVTQPVAERTVAVPGPTRTVTQTVPGPTRTVTHTQTVPVPGPTRTVPVPGPTQTVTVPSSTDTSSGTRGASSNAGPASAHGSDTSSTNGDDSSGQMAALGTQTQASGTVESLGDDGRTVTIRHGALAPLGMPQGTDSFVVRDASILSGVSAGDQVNFVLQRTDQGWTIMGLAATGR